MWALDRQQKAQAAEGWAKTNEQLAIIPEAQAEKAARLETEAQSNTRATEVVSHVMAEGNARAAQATAEASARLAVTRQAQAQAAQATAEASARLANAEKFATEARHILDNEQEPEILTQL